MKMTSFGKIILALIVLSGGAAAYAAMKSNDKPTKSTSSQEEKVETIAEAMRDFQSLPGSASDAEINNWKTQMKRMVKPNNQKSALCQLYATQATMIATVERATRRSGNQEMIADVQADINAIPPGSLEDWLFQLARRGAQPVEFVNHECMQQPTVHVLNPGIRRNSQEMRNLEEECLAAGTC